MNELPLALVSEPYADAFALPLADAMNSLTELLLCCKEPDFTDCYYPEPLRTDSCASDRFDDACCFIEPYFDYRRDRPAALWPALFFDSSRLSPPSNISSAYCWSESCFSESAAVSFSDSSSNSAITDSST